MTQLMRSTVPLQDVCPGKCNDNHRARPSAFEPVYGEPVWCALCSADIADAIGALPGLAVDLWAIGHWTVDPMQPVADREVETVSMSTGEVLRVVLREVLACGHRWPVRVAAREEDLPAPAEARYCWQCAIDDPGADGRLAPVEAAARRGPRLKGSPAGSASYLAIDELVMWAARTADYLKARLPGEQSPAPDPRSADDARRAEALSTACGFLVEWIHHLLATPHARAIGKEALDLERRARRSAGADYPPDMALPGVPCPRCDRVTVKRRGRTPSQLWCMTCSNIFPDSQVPA